MSEKIIDNDFLPFDLANIEKTSYFKNEFSKGVKVGSFYSGIIVSLLNTGISEEYVPAIFYTIMNDGKERYEDGNNYDNNKKKNQ